MVNNKKLQWILGIYLAILLLSAAAVYMIPKESFFAQDILTSEKIAKAQLAAGNLYEAAIEGKLDQVEGVSVNGQWNFDYTGNELKIIETDHNLTIIAQRKEADDNKIEVSSYMPLTILEGIDFTGRIEPPKVMLVGNELIIKTMDLYQVEFVKFDRDFTVAQFWGNGAEQGRQGHQISHVAGNPLLYLRIPKGLQIDSDHPGFQIIPNR